MEIEILKYINNHLHSSNFFNYFFKVITIISDNGYIWIALGLILLIFKKTRKAGFLTLMGAAATFVINSIILKMLFNRARPFTEATELATFINSIGLELPTSNSFPSGHAFSSFCCATILSLQLKKKWPLVYIFAFLVATSRVFLCVHYPTDVLAGIVIGSAVGVAIHFVMNYILKKLDEFILKHRNKKDLVKATANEQVESENKEPENSTEEQIVKTDNNEE